LNFLAHLVLAGDDEGLRLGAMLGDFLRGRQVLESYPEPVRDGVMLHRRIDAFSDSLPEVAYLRNGFRPPFRRYAGIVIDLGIDHELACNWSQFRAEPLEDFDRGVRELLARHRELMPERLLRFMAYADRRGLFAAYRGVPEILHSLRGIGRRLSRPNPLHRVEEVWERFEPELAACFQPIMLRVQSEVSEWLKAKSTTTGS
jgi:acyl carrier protein phosphodiesterase